MILLSETIENDSLSHIGTLPVVIKRNAYGRQSSSFTTDAAVECVGEYPMVFIRAPYIDSVSEGVKVLATVDDHIVAVQYHNQIGLSFHPELTSDPRIHEYFLQVVKERNESHLKRP